MANVVQIRKGSTKTAGCAWCGERKPLNLMRHPLSSRGPTPSTCHACRVAHPGESWCDFHGGPHPIGRFPTVDRPIGILNVCHDGAAYAAAAKRAKPPRSCVVCEETRESWYFRGGRVKSPVCRICEDENEGTRWCVECRTWLALGDFHRTGRDNRSLTRRCKVCDLAFRHGISRARYDELVGDSPQCAVCGATEALKIDHDHAHCPTTSGCVGCVRGILCHSCNTAEGLLRNSRRARLLADYMEKWSVSD